jgi:prolyl oligopeptidase
MNTGLQNQNVLYTLDRIGDTPKVLIDPNLFSEDGTTSLQFAMPSKHWIAYGLSESGSDWEEIRVRNIETGEDLPDLLKWVKFVRVAWAPDESGFYYARYDKPAEHTELNYNLRIYFHRLRGAQEEDLLIYERPDHPDWILRPITSEDGRFLMITAYAGCDLRTGIFIKDLEIDSPIQELVTTFDAEYAYVDNDGDQFWIQTTQGAPRGRLIAIQQGQWTEIIPEQEEILLSVHPVGGKFLVHYIKDTYAEVKQFTLDGTFEKQIPIPAHGSLLNFNTGWDSPHNFSGSDTEIFYGFTSFTEAPTIYRYDFLTETSQALYQSHSTDQYESSLHFYKSRDGTRIPITLCYKKGTKLQDNHPTCLYGYGGFGIPILPTYSPQTAVWLDLGGIMAIAHLRGGSEYGSAWHEAGMKEKKQNVFDDFICAAEWLIDEGITSTPRLGIWGRSNGGLLVGACLTQRPELFGVALPDVGVLDMLRFHLFTIGWSWTTEYGSPDNPSDYAFLRRYSPLHNIRPVAYPPTLVLTSEQDDRVVPSHSYKFAAALQAAKKGPAPILIRIESSAGHGAGKPTSKILDEAADRLAFLFHHTTHDQGKAAIP